ncbi:uncharacterized protein LOC134223687 [Armigeres subalbatus]|uniref:uncharacterized protein LOC134223687 n=1 Tax=Armigeres subalbatus TaxID=124917 RepID=UPI002ED1371F
MKKCKLHQKLSIIFHSGHDQFSVYSLREQKRTRKLFRATPTGSPPVAEAPPTTRIRGRLEEDPSQRVTGRVPRSPRIPGGDTFRFNGTCPDDPEPVYSHATIYSAGPRRWA